MEELNNLKLAIIKMLLKNKDLDKPYLRTKGQSFSCNEIIAEIQSNGKIGNDFVNGLIMLATDLVMRNKESL